MSKVAQLVGRPKIGLDELLSTGNSDQPEHLSVGSKLPTRAWSILTVTKWRFEFGMMQRAAWMKLFF